MLFILNMQHLSVALSWPLPFLIALLGIEVMPPCVGGEINVINLPDCNHAIAPISNWDALRHPTLLVARGLFVPSSCANATQEPCGRNHGTNTKV